jgi:hypothetical protein
MTKRGLIPLSLFTELFSIKVNNSTQLLNTKEKVFLPTVAPVVASVVLSDSETLRISKNKK